MQHVNVCLQALLKGFEKACREKQEQEGVACGKGEETVGVKSLCALYDRPQKGSCYRRHDASPQATTSNIQIDIFLHPLSPFPSLAGGLEAQDTPSLISQCLIFFIQPVIHCSLAAVYSKRLE